MSNEEYLLKNSWVKINEHGWNDKDNNFHRGGLSIDYAVKVQKEYDTLNKMGRCFIPVRNKYGYGWEIKVYTDRNKKDYKATGFNQLSIEECLRIIDILNNGEAGDNPHLFYVTEEFNYVLILKEKHGERYFHVPTLDKLYNAAKRIFKERMEDGWYNFDELEIPEKPDISLEQAGSIKNEIVKKAILDAWNNYNSYLKYNESTLKEKKLYEQALKDEKGDICLAFLYNSKGGEYEGFEIEALE